MATELRDGHSAEAQALGFDAPMLERGVAVGWASDQRALVWARCPGTPWLLARTASGVQARGRAQPGADGCVTLVLEGLTPDRPYEVSVVEEGSEREVGRATFHTAPVPGQMPSDDTFCFAVVSCNSPFTEEGCLDQAALSFVHAAHGVLHAHGCRRVFFVGDQVYADQPESRSLFNAEYLRKIRPARPDDILQWDAEAVREMYHLRHRLFLANPAVRQLMSSWSGSYMLDDHEVIDNFGCAKEHGEPAYAALREGALAAYYNYQGRRVCSEPTQPAQFDHGMQYGPIAAHVLDLRSNKRVRDDGTLQVVSEAQLEELADFLARSVDAQVVLIVVTVPVLHAAQWLSTIGAWVMGKASDAHDRWSYPGARHSRDALLRILHAHHARASNQRMLLMGGDIHVGMVSEIYWRDDEVGLLQLTSSALTNRQSPLVQRAAEWTPHLHTSMDIEGLPSTSGRMLEGIGAMKRNPCGGLNVGVIAFRNDAGRLRLRLKLFEEDEQGGAALVYESAEF